MLGKITLIVLFIIFLAILDWFNATHVPYSETHYPRKKLFSDEMDIMVVVVGIIILIGIYVFNTYF